MGNLFPLENLHNTQWGYICPAESPEGAISRGCQKYNIYGSYYYPIQIRQNIYELLVEKYVIQLMMQIRLRNNLFNKVKIFINGNWIGITCNEPEKLYHKLLKEAKY